MTKLYEYSDRFSRNGLYQLSSGDCVLIMMHTGDERSLCMGYHKGIGFTGRINPGLLRTHLRNADRFR